MATQKLVWEQGKRNARASFTIPYVGKLSLEVETQFPGAGDRESPIEHKELALRHAKLLVRNLANALDRQSV